MVALTDRSTLICSTSSEVMPVQEFALDSAGTERVQIFQESSGEGVTYILFNHAIVGSISHREELRAGKTLTLQGGSVLLIQQTNEGYQVMCDGQPLRLVSPAERETAQKRALVHHRGERLTVLLPRIIGIGLVLGIVGYLLFASQSASSLPSASQPASYSIVFI